VPFAGQKAEMYLRRIIRVGQEIGARGFMQSHAAHNLELLQRLPGKKGKGLEHNSGKYLETR
jgi:hypothetical protein